ncbi:Dam family site-specific DNA-(adenine-N6)-methyltransferase [Paraglaciecola aquimarina]|uniref:Site-specific DNA-methyltransferase (adenine-specific) n=1 Tax=Paraglaciecola aquimarina TaxID=1235557 RepID=A0ABU3SS23_9ALTE|nr:Dam family site-specific DNA-(adenine-N6)-methyltransferase [Paraglaciecola aquimarina]MDU0352795.1 Dam family site-specific DNA-(adenine-N6)-methyltransferase [Paraglaciecola aquimarina]
MKNKKSRAFLKWAGGKYNLVEAITEQLPQGRKLIEPFVGAGSVFLNTDYPKYLLNDINPDLINLYNIVKTQSESYIADSATLFNAQHNQEKRYYELRDKFNRSTDIYERAVLFLYLNRHGYNGLCRYNNSGGFNVPFGRYKAPYFPEKELIFFAEKAKKATFTCESFEKTFSKARKHSVIYCDPPYAPISKTAMFNAYAKGGFTLDCQVRLAAIATRTFNHRNIPVLISNHDTEFTRSIYQDAEISTLQVSRFISQNGGNRKKAAELFALYSHTSHISK